MAKAFLLVLQFSESSMERVNQLEKDTESSQKEVIANALRVYEALIKEGKAESEFFIKRKGGKIEPYQIFE